MGLRVDGSRVLLSGASSGIGAALARLLSASGATVGLAGRRADRLGSVLADCQARSPESRSWVVDLEDTEAARLLAEEAWRVLGHLDVLVNNAGTPMRRHASGLLQSDLERTMRVNFLSPAVMTLAVLPLMLERGKGMVVNVASIGGRVGIAHEAAYCASKFAICGWSESLAIDLDGSGVEVRLIQPGPVATDIWDRPGNDPAVLVPPLETPEVVAEGILAAMEGDRFEHYLPDLSSVVALKHADPDAYLRANAELRRSSEGSR